MVWCTFSIQFVELNTYLKLNTEYDSIILKIDRIFVPISQNNH